MNKNKSSFHMGDQINGYGQKIILKADQITPPPVSQENVRLTPNFNKYLLKIIFSVPYVSDSEHIEPVLSKMIGSLTAVNQVIFSDTSDISAAQTSSFDFQVASSHVSSGGSLVTAFGKKTNDKGQKQTGWQTKKKKKYYYNSDGEMVQSEFQKIDGKWYYFHEDGHMAQNEFIKNGKDTHFIDNNGNLVTSRLITIEGKTYYFDSAGRLQTGQKLINGKQYFFGANGAEVKIYNIKDFIFFSTDNQDELKNNQELAAELMKLYQQYEKYINQEPYVTQGSILACTYGTKLSSLDTSATANICDKGTGQPILQCDDCKVGENIYSFYSCRAPEYSSLPMRTIMDDGYKKCIPLLGSEWSQSGDNAPYIWDCVSGDCSMALKKSSGIVCIYLGYIGILEVPEKEVEGLTLEKCIQKMEEYLQTGTLDDNVITWMAENGAAIVNKFGSGQFYNHPNDTIYHEELLAWTNFWNYRIINYSDNPYPNKTPIRANVAKAIIAQESSMGTAKGKNSSRNVMGCLFAGDPTLWIASAIDPLVEGKYHRNGKNKPVITVRKIDGTVEPDGALIEIYDPAETHKYRFGTGFRFLDSVIQTTGGGSTGNEYLIEYSAMSIRMGIAIGIGTLAYKINIRADGNEKIGVMEYGTGSGYDVLINQHLSELGTGLL